MSIGVKKVRDTLVCGEKGGFGKTSHLYIINCDIEL